MNETLFPLPISLSPRLKWINEHGVTTYYEPAGALGDDAGWSAYIGTNDEESEEMEEAGRLCFGHTEDEALERLAKAQSWRLWNEV